jgi:hypothetical protein
MAVIGCPEKDPPWHPGEGFVLKAIGGGESMSAKEYRRPLPTGLATPPYAAGSALPETTINLYFELRARFA